jgi:sn-glycerol 3-phosphate transport system permease protein
MTGNATSAAASARVSTATARAARREGMTAFLFLLPSLVVFLVFVFYPLAQSFSLSVHSNDIIGRPTLFVGLRNYVAMLTGPDFRQVLWTTFSFAILTVVPGIAIALGLALLLTARIRGIRFFRTVFALPFAFSVATSAVVFSVLFNSAVGVLNGFLYQLGSAGLSWLTDPGIALVSIAIATVWLQLGYDLLVLAAGLGAIPDELYEAARLDGASGWRLARSITLPLLAPQLFFLIVVSTIQSLQNFGQIYILTRGGPSNSTTTLVYSIYSRAFAFGSSDFGFASAEAVVLLLVVLVITTIQFGILERRVFYR